VGWFAKVVQKAIGCNRSKQPRHRGSGVPPNKQNARELLPLRFLKIGLAATVLVNGHILAKP